MCECEVCPFENPPNRDIFYEVHISVHTNDLERFIETCAFYRVKPIILDLMKEGIPNDVITSSKHTGTYTSVVAEAVKLAHQISDSDFNVTRTKIETVPWHPNVPSEKNGLDIDTFEYFEAHLKCHVWPDDVAIIFPSMCRRSELHPSRSVFKKLENGKLIIMATYRSHVGNVEEFTEEVETKRNRLVTMGFRVENPIIEFCLFDTNEGQDREWLSSNIRP